MENIRSHKRNINQNDIEQRLRNVSIDKPVLIVEGSPVIAKILLRLLENKGCCDIHLAENLADTKQLLNQYWYDYHVAICDLTLPDTGNGEIVNLLTKAKVNMIIMSGSRPHDIVNLREEKYVIDFINKAENNALEYASDLVVRLYKNNQVKALVVDDSRSAIELTSAM